MKMKIKRLKVVALTLGYNGERRRYDVEEIAPGLAIGKTPLHRGDWLGWSVVHMKSGFAAVQFLATRKEAIRAAKWFAPLTDWTKDREEVAKSVLERHPKIKEECKRWKKVPKRLWLG